jgi:hypothetical protein
MCRAEHRAIVCFSKGFEQILYLRCISLGVNSILHFASSMSHLWILGEFNFFHSGMNRKVFVLQTNEIFNSYTVPCFTEIVYLR